jgi:DNA-binding NtrC family response regulator
MLRALLLDRDETLHGRIEELRIEDLSVQRVAQVDEAVSVLENGMWDLIFIREPGTADELVASVRRMVRTSSAAPVVVLSGNPSVPNSVAALKSGAFDYRETPQSVVGLHELLQELAPGGAGRTGLVASSQKMRDLVMRMREIANEVTPVLILGERGAGKKRIARTIHAWSSRAELRLAIASCEATPVEAIDSELFGHVQGAVRGSEQARAGLIHVAAGGTLILDEVAGLPPPTQRAVADFLASSQVRMVGGRRSHRIDVRVIATASQALEPLVADGRSSLGLFRSLSRIRLAVPPLRERIEDLETLVQVLGDEAARRHGRRPPLFSSQAIELLRSHPWRGNVTELWAVIDAVVSSAQRRTVNADDLPDDLVGASQTAGDSELPLAEIEKRHILRVLRAANGNRSQAARILGIDRKTLRDKLRKMGEDG